MMLVAATALAVGTAIGQQAAAPATDSRMQAGFAEVDVDKDGVIELDEIVGQSIYLFTSQDRNGDRFLSMDELPGHDPARFRRADRNGDGRLSHGEVAGDKVIEFFEADTDGNGVLSLQEIQAFEAKVSGARK
jgi:hypothetical protein